MHFVVMGCGRVGASLALEIESLGHSVAVIDQDSGAFRRLGPAFSGSCVTGVGFDRETLVRAEIEEAYAFASVASGDNSNILAARVARETFGVRNVVARIYDPDRADLYERLGIATVATVRWASNQMLRRMIPASPREELQDISGRLILADIAFDPAWAGTPLPEVERASSTRVAYLTRRGEGVLPEADDVLQDGDVLHLMMRTEDLGAVEVLLAHRPQRRTS
jgi:trk system potassium uptake protein